MRNLYCCCHYSEDSIEDYYGHVFADKYDLDEEYEEAFFYDSNDNLIAIIPNTNRVNEVCSIRNFT